MHEVRVPSLAENVNEATVGRWLVEEGQTVAAGDGVVELLTEKAEFALEIENGGKVSAILAPTKSVMPVGSILCLLDASDHQIRKAALDNEQRMAQHLAADTIMLPVEGQEPEVKDAPGVAAKNVRATPAARRLAKENKLDLAAIAEKYGIVEAIKEEHVRRFLDEA